MIATGGRLVRGARGAELWLPPLVLAVALATVLYGFADRARGNELGASLAPFLWEWSPRLVPAAAPAIVLLTLAAALAPRLRRPAVSPAAFVLATLALGLALRVALGSARQGLEGLWSVYEIGKPEAASEYLPALPAFDFGLRTFLDTFAEVGTALPVHAVGHPPGLLVLLHLLGVDGARAMAALTIGLGALAIPLCYLLARTLLDETRARTAALLFVFSPTALLYGATSADALYATLALAAAIPLAGFAVQRRGGMAGLGLGSGLLAVASFFSYANLAIGAWAAILAADRGWRRALVLAAACAGALAISYGLLAAATGYDPVGALASAESVYREGIAGRRPYAFWAFGSPTAFLGAVGLPIAWFALRAAGARQAPALALLAVVAVASVLGFAKAETERIYQFLVPIACVAAAGTMPERLVPASVGVLAGQALAIELLVYTVW